MENTTKLVIDTNLDAATYIFLVDNIALEFFSEDGVYQPHIGHLNTIRLFYNCCVKQSQYDATIPHDFVDMSAIDILSKDDEFMDAFNEAMYDYNFKMTFRAAYDDAMQIVEHKKNSFASITDAIVNALEQLVDKMAPVLTKDNIESVARIADGMSKGETTAQAFVEEYIKSQRFKDVVSAKK